MDRKGRKKVSVLGISFMLIGILLGISAEGSWAQAPVVQNYTPATGTTNALINTQIRIQFNMTMNTGAGLSFIEIEDDFGRTVPGSIQWGTTTNLNDTLIFIPQKGLNPATGYDYSGLAQSSTGSASFGSDFITKPSLADVTPPTVQTTYPYPNMTNVGTTKSIIIRFSDTMNPTSITTPGNITLTGPCMGGATDYTIDYSIGDRDVEIRKSTPFAAYSQCTVTVTTNVRDVRGNPLKNQYSWNFQTGGTDTTNPTVTQTIPVGNDTKVNLFTSLYAIFSEEMDEGTLNPTNITLYDNTALTGVPINIYSTNEDLVSFGPQSALTYNHQYTVTIGTGVKDRAGNSLTQKTWSFTTALNSSTDSDPILNYIDTPVGKRWADGTTNVSFELAAWDDVTNPLTVTATTPPAFSWSLTGSPTGFGIYSYNYESTGNENLSAGNHTVTFTIQDSAANTVSVQRNIYIFSASPTLTSPANGATGVSTTPTFTWTYGGSPRPVYYRVAVYDGPDMDTASMVWMGIMVDKGSGTHSITIPSDKPLSPNKTYYWGVRGANNEENGETFTGLWPFTTSGTPPPEARFVNVYVQSDDIYPPALQGRLVAFVLGPSPADIAELKVTGPGGFQYFFTEDDLSTSEKLGQYYAHNFSNPLSDGTYTFSLTDSAGRTVTTTKDFAYASVPRVSDASMTPGDNNYVNTTTPTLSWGSAGPGVYYRAFIFDWNFGQLPIYASDFTQETSITIPSGYLLPNASYIWRVDVFDAPYGSNRSRSNNLRFSTGSSSYTPDISWAYVWNENNHYSGAGKTLGARVMDTLPNEVTQLRVTWPSSGSYDFTESNILYNLSNQDGNFYNVWQTGTATDGTYNLSLQTPRGNDNWSKDQTSTILPIVDQSSMVPANNAYIDTLTPTLTWTPVGGSPRYYSVLIQDWRHGYIIYSSATLTGTSLTIPAGVLKPNRSYTWRVQVYDNANTGTADNRSTSAWNCFTTPDGTRFDFNGDSKADILWRNVSSGSNISGWTNVWQMDGTTASDGGAPAKVDDSNWQIKGMGDFNNDGSADIFWQHIPSGWTYIWFMKGGTILYGGAPAMVGDPNWQIKGMGDFNGDGKEDVIWQNISTGEPISGWTYIWLMDGSMIQEGEALRQVDASWQIKAIGDFNGDKKADILWQHTSGWLYIWFMDGANVIDESAVAQVTDPSFQIKGIGDFNGDGKADILWYHTTTGWVSLWQMDGSTVAGGGAIRQVGDLNWQIQGVGDYNGDRKTDLLWRDAVSGWTLVWIMDGSTIVQEGSPGLVGDPNWQIVH